MTIKQIATRLDQIVAMSAMQPECAISLLSSSVLALTGQCYREGFIAAIAHTRLAIRADFQDATASLAGLLDEIESKAARVK